MADPTWDDTEPAEAPPQWEETAPVGTGPTASPATAAATGLVNGATLNWAPSLGALGKTAMDAITGTKGPLAGGDLDELIDEYKSQRDKLKDDFAKAAAAHPKIALAGQVAGGAAALAPLGAAATAPKVLAATGGMAGLGGSTINSAEDIPQAAVNTAVGAGTALAGGTAIKAAAPYVGKALAPVGSALKSAAGGIADWLGSGAEKLAEKATGATGAQAGKFADNTGRELLDRGIVKFGSSPGDIAANANASMEASSSGISGALDTLDKNGVTVDRNTVLKYIQDKIDSMAGDDSQIELSKSLQQKVADIESQIPEVSTDVNAEDTTEAPSDSQLPISQAEEIKRGYQSKVNWNAPQVENNANAIVSGAYKQAVEDAATQADPTIGGQFKADKETFGLLSPVKEAAEKRASTLNQNPIGGLLDVSTGAAGYMAGGAPGSAASLIAKRTLTPRLASMGAVASDKLAQVVASTPSAFGKFASVLKSAAARGGESLGATDYILQQTNPEYREQRDKVFNPEQRLLGDYERENRSPADGEP